MNAKTLTECLLQGSTRDKAIGPNVIFDTTESNSRNNKYGLMESGSDPQEKKVEISLKSKSEIMQESYSNQ